LGLTLASTSAAAQSLELSPMVGLTLSTSLDEKAAGVNTLRVASGFTWGGDVTYRLSQHIGVGALFMQQPTDMTLRSGGVSAELFEMNVTQFLGNVVYQPVPEDAAVRPFVFGGVGATIFSSDDFDSETKLAWTFGAGMKWFPTPRVGARFQLRYKPTILNDSDASVCDPFGFCQGILHQMELAAGAVIRF
jgi:opacity protein-like surface antigen